MTWSGAIAPATHLTATMNRRDGCNPCLPATGHAAMNVCMSDASVRAHGGNIDRLVWWALVTPAGGEPSK